MKHNKTRKQKKGGKYSQRSGSRNAVSKAKSMSKSVKDLAHTVSEELVKDSIKKTAENAIKNKQLLLQSPALIRTTPKNSNIPTSVFSKLAKIADPNKILANESIKANTTSFISPDKTKSRSNTNTTTTKKSRPTSGAVLTHTMDLNAVRKDLFSSPKK